MSSWEGWTERFAAHGYDVHVPAEPPGVFGLEELTARYEKTVRSQDRPPVLIGHSVGGLIARQLLDAGLGRAAVAIAPLPPLVPLSSDKAGTQSEGYTQLLQPLFRHTIANAVGEEEAAQLYARYVVPAPRRLLIDLGLDDSMRSGGDMAMATGEGVVVDAATRGPLLLISGQEDRMVTDAVTRATYKLYGDSTAVTDLKQFADRGHSLVFDSGWPAVADYVLAWLAANGITTPAEHG